MESKGAWGFISYILGKLLLIALAAGLIAAAFFTGIASANVHVVVSDAFAKRASVMLSPEENADSEIIPKLFTADWLISSGLLTEVKNPGVEILSFHQRTDVPFTAVWPWQKQIEMDVTDQLKDVKISASQGEAIDVNTLDIPSGVYHITVIKTTEGKWVISALDMKEPIEIEYDAPTPSASPKAAEADNGPEEEA